MKIVGIIGTVFGTKTSIALNHFKTHNNLEMDIIDLADYKLEFADSRFLNEYNDDTIKVINKIMEADAIVIATPVYQASIPGSLKNLFDLLPLDAIRDKTVGILVSSGSDKHYLVAEYQLIPILNYLKANVINKYVYITLEDYNVNKIDNSSIDMRMEDLSKEIHSRIKSYKDQFNSYDF